MLPKYKNKGFNLVQLTNAWNLVSLSVQKRQPASISGFMIERERERDMFCVFYVEYDIHKISGFYGL